jgi:hypothetical protein
MVERTSFVAGLSLLALAVLLPHTILLAEQNSTQPPPSSEMKADDEPTEEEADQSTHETMQALASPKDINAILDSTRISLDFNEASLEDIIDYISQLADINIIIHPKAYQNRDGTERQFKISIKLKQLPLRQVLNLLLEYHDLKMQIKKDFITIVPRWMWEDEIVLRMYDVRSLLFKIRDFPGPTIELREGEQPGTEVQELFSPQDDENRPLSDQDTFVRLIRELIGEQNPAPGTSISIVSGWLVVRHKRQVHELIIKLISELSQFK